MYLVLYWCTVLVYWFRFFSPMLLADLVGLVAERLNQTKMAKQQNITSFKRKPSVTFNGTVAHNFGKDTLEASEMNRIADLLTVDLAQDELSTRKGAGNQKFTYMEGWRVIEASNKIFGYNGWSSQILNMIVERHKQGSKFFVKVNAIVRVTLRNGSFHEDVGVGESSSNREVDAEQKACKTAITDARKRALRCFGRALGNCVYDKAYVNDKNKKQTAAQVPNFNHTSSSTSSSNTGAPPANISSRSPQSPPPALSVIYPAVLSSRNQNQIPPSEPPSFKYSVVDSQMTTNSAASVSDEHFFACDDDDDAAIANMDLASIQATHNAAKKQRL
jgi:DNA recombination protein Rad52